MPTIANESSQIWENICIHTDAFSPEIYETVLFLPVMKDSIYNAVLQQDEWLSDLEADIKFIFDLLAYEFLKDLEESES